MRKFLIALIGLVMVLVLIAGIACTSDSDDGDLTDEQKSEDFGIYLVGSGELVLSEEHIEAYYPETHTIELNEEGIEKWNSYMTYTTIPKLDRCLFSKDFILKIKGEEIYRGNFYSMASSIADPGIVIMDALFKLDSTHNIIWIETSYPVSFAENQDDPRNDPRIIEFFEEKGLLKDGEPPSWAMTEKAASGPESSPISTIGDKSQWDDFQGFSAGDNYDGYHLENGSTVYYLKGGITSVYGPDNELILCVNDADVNQVPVPGGKGPQPATHVLNLPNGSVITHDGFITRAAGLTIVDLSTSSYDDKFVDREAFSGFWQAAGGDIAIPESEREPGKIYNYDGYGIKVENDDRARITFNNEIDQTKLPGIIDEDEIRLSFGSFEAIFRFHDENIAFAAFYDDDRVYVRQLTKQRHVSIGTILGPQVKPQPGEYLPCGDQESSVILLKSVKVETEVSDREFFNPAAGLEEGRVSPGDLIIKVTGEMEYVSGHGPSTAILTPWAQGYDSEGNEVAWTLDGAHIAGQPQLEVERGKPEQFTLHLSFSDDVRLIEIYSCAYFQTPP